MAFRKNLIAALACACASTLIAPVHAESQFVSGAGSATARLDIRVVIPRILYLAVGTGHATLANNNTIDLLTFDYTTAASTVGNGTPSAAQSVTARVLGNNGQITIAASGTTGGLSTGGSSPDSIPWTQIGKSSSDATNFNVPAVGSSAQPVINSGKVTNRTATWSYQYLNSNVVPPGTYDGRITYTASMP
ncbi:MAG: hypothetical protein NZ533_02660 [Casimicrobiaceae bacterium]|nr:hypothetical protein [Casimicrobiaceae bacterium]MCX8099586.1 hypothetical protein [Casimicrobiaceae bacterium]MDW8312706.1 hypothetical protein [Burkholderiales bacterium]